MSTIFIPMLYTPVKWYYVLVAYIVAPLFALPVSWSACINSLTGVLGLLGL